MSFFAHSRHFLAAAVLLLAIQAHADHVKVFLLGGQSNMVGNFTLSSELPAALQDPQADVLYYPGALTTLRPGFGLEFGPEVSFGRSVADAFPAETFCLIQRAVNGSSLLVSWNPATGTSYAAFRTRVESGLAALTAAGHSYEIVGMLWTQGEAEAANGTTTPTYQAALNEFIADVRSRYGPNLPFFVSRLSSGQTSIPANGLSTIRAAQEAVATNDPHTYLVDTDAITLGSDNVHFSSAGQVSLGQAFGLAYADSVVPDVTGPAVTALSPANGFAEHPATNNLVIHFDEPVVFDTGFIRIRESAGDALVEQFDVANPPANLSSNLSGATLTIDLSANLSYATAYYVEIDATAIADNSGNHFAGFSSPSAWTFTTAAAKVGGLIDGAQITVTVSSINASGAFPPQSVVDGSGLDPVTGEHGSGKNSEWVSNIGANITNGFIAFDLGGSYVLDSIQVWNYTQTLNYGVKQLDIYVSDVFAAGDPEGAGAANWTKIADNVTFAAAGSPNIGFDLETQTGITLPTYAVRHIRFETDTRQDDATSGYFGLAEVQFFAASSGPDASAPTLASLNPVNGASDVPTTANLEITFNEAVAFGTGFITIRETAGGAVLESYDVATAPAKLSLNGGTLTINPTADLAAATGYYIEIAPTAIEDLAGNPFAGISGSATWGFTTDAPDTTDPTLSSLNPVNGAFDVPTTANLEITFNEAVTFGTGFITIRETAGGTAVESYEVATAPANLSLSGGTLTINPSAALADATSYYIEIAQTAIEDLAGNPFAGISGSATWGFTTAAAEAQAGGLILQPSAITATSQVGTVYNASFAGDQSGFLDAGSYTSGVSDFATTLATLQHVNGNNGTGGTSAGWASSFNPNLDTDPQASGNAGVLVIDMGATVNVSRIGIWVYLNSNPVSPNAGVFDSTREFEVFSADSGTLTTATLTSLGVFTLPDTNDARTGLAFDITDATSRYFVINIRNLHTDSDPNGNDHASFGEIAFEAAGTAPGNDFADWIAGYPAVGTMTGFGDDPDHDGIANGLENFFGTDPGAYTVGLVAGELADNSFTFTHPLNASPADNIVVAYYWSTDLVTFNDDGATQAGTRVDFVPGIPTGGMVAVTATITGTSIDRLFIQLGVTQN